MALPAEPERWPRRLARAGWRALVVGAALGGLTYLNADAPFALGVALTFAVTVAAVDLAERAARSRAPDRRRDLALAAVAWIAASGATLAGAAQTAFVSARAGGASLEAAWGDAFALDALGGWPAALALATLAGCVAPGVLRQALLRVDRRLKLLASPRALADAATPDPAAIAAAQAPGALREQAALAADPARPEAVRAAAVEALARAGVEDARARLLDLARDPSPSTRALAAGGLARKAPCARAERALALLAGDPALEVRRAALLALSAFPGGATVAAQRLAVEADPGLRAAALQALTTAGGASELPGLLTLARTAPPAERPRALRAADAVARRTGSPWPDDLPRSAGAPLRLLEPSAPATPAGEAP